MLKTIFQKFQKKQGCVVIAGHDIELIDQNFVILEALLHKDLIDNTLLI